MKLEETTFLCMRCQLEVRIEATGGFAPLCVLCGTVDGYTMTPIHTHIVTITGTVAS